MGLDCARADPACKDLPELHWLMPTRPILLTTNWPSYSLNILISQYSNGFDFNTPAFQS